MIEAAPPEHWAIDINWADAQFYCFMLNIDGVKGWRLPSVDELINLRHTLESGAALKEGENSWVWSNKVVNDQCYQYYTGSGEIDFFTVDDFFKVMTVPVRTLY